MGLSNYGHSNLDVVKKLCDDLEGVFEAFQMDKVWDAHKNKVTICFTAEKIHKRYLPN